MEVRCRCPSCQAKFKVDAKYVGKKARCPKCQTVVEVPQQSLDESSSSMSALNLGQPLPTGPGVSGSVVLPNLPASPAPGRSGVFAPPAPAPGIPAAPFGPQQPAAPQQPTFAPHQQPAFDPQQPAFAPAPGQPTFLPGQPAPQQAAPVFAPAPTAIHPSPSASSRPMKGHGKSPPLSVPLLLGGGLAAIALVGIGVVIAVLATGGGDSGPKPIRKPKPGVASATSSATLVIDWPTTERSGGALTIDGQKKTVTAAGPLRFLLGAGTHRLLLQRRNYEPVETEITLAKGATENFSPQWRASSVAAPTTGNFLPQSVPSGASPAAASGFPIGTGVGSLSPKGFDGWLQNLDTAKRQAAEGQLKNILIVFGCSDAQSATQELAHRLNEAGVKNNQVCVIIDFPRTEDGFNLIEDRGHNEQLIEDFGIDRLPVLALTDEQGRTFFVKREWEDGFANLQERVATWTAERTRRDELLAAAAPGSDDKLPAAAAAVKWLQDNKVWRFYGSEISGWLTAAQRADPDNQQTLLETFFEPRWFLDVMQVNEEDGAAVGRIAAQLDPWIGRGGFHDQDRGAKLHMTAAMLLAKVQRFDDATRQLEQAVKYKPKDADLADAVSGLKTRLENKDILGSGTGYLVSSAGYILTNHHVIDGPGRVEVRIPGGKETVSAQIVAQDEDRDMALIKVAFPDPSQFQPVAVEPGLVRRGVEVGAFGFPLGDALGTGLKFTGGKIAALPDATNEMYLLDLKVNPGNSGGPLCNARGNVVGMVTAKTSNTDLEDSYGMAIPATILLEFLDQHLPPAAPRPASDPAAAAMPWDQVDMKVSPGVLMIVKKR